MRRLTGYWLMTAFMVLAWTAAGAQVPTPTQNPGQNPAQSGAPSDNAPATSATSPQSSGTPAVPDSLKQGVTISGKPLHGERPLPKLPRDEFMKCYRMYAGFQSSGSGSIMDTLTPMSLCEEQRQWEEHTVIESCLYPLHGETPLRMVQACTETLGHDLLASSDQYYVFAARADAYFVYGDPQHAIADYGTAIKLAPHEGKLYYNRAVVYAAQSDANDALRDLDTAIGLQPKNARFWGERGSVCIKARDYQSAIKDETEAIQLAPKLAPAYFLRADALASVGNRTDAVSDLHTAIDLDPSLAHYVVIQGKTVSLQPPPL